MSLSPESELALLNESVDRFEAHLLGCIKKLDDNDGDISHHYSTAMKMALDDFKLMVKGE